MSLEMIMQSIVEYGLIAMFIIIFLEYACLPLPSEIVLTFSGAIAAQGKTPFLVILGVSVLAGMLGALACYFLGFIGGNALIDGLGKKFPKMQKGLEASRLKYEKYATLSVGIGRVIPLCRTYISFIAGVAKQDLKSYIVASTIGITFWNIILVGAGYIFSDNWERVVAYHEKYSGFLIPIIFLLAAVFLTIKWYGNKSIKED